MTSGGMSPSWNSIGLGDHGGCGSWCRNRVRVSVDKFPHAVLEAKKAGHSQGQCRYLVAAPDFRTSMFYLDDARQTIGYVFRNEIHVSDFAVPIIPGGCSKRFHDLPPTVRKRSERISQSDVVLVGKQRLGRLRITAKDR